MPRDRSSTRRCVVLAAVLSTALAATACAADATPGAASSAPSPHSSSSAAAPGREGPAVDVDNCGTAITFNAAPERVLAIKSTSIEMLLALGLQDRIIGTAFPDGDPSPRWADRAEDLALVSERVPGPEATLALEPDLVYAGWESNVTADGAGERSALAALGVATYVSPAACKDPAFRPDPLTFDDVFAEIGEVGDIFRVPDRAAALVDEQRAALDAVVPDTRGLTALWYSSGSDTPYVGGGIGAPQLVLDAAGLINIAADVDDAWSSLSWEAVVDADPDVIVLVDSSWGSVDKKIGVLQENPATARLDAVREGRYVVVPFPAGEAGVRSVEAVESVVEQLAGIDVAGTSP